MIVLGIESTAHTFGVAVLRDKEVLSNVMNTFSTKKGGMIPARVADHHVEICDLVLSESLEKAEITLKDIELISYSRSPGLGHALRIGASFARSLSLLLDIPIVGVNHCVAHLEIGRMRTGAKDPVLLYASGANTQIIAYEGGRYRVFGETLDIGVGNFLDQLGRVLGLGFPAGPAIEKFASKWDHDELISLPYTVKGMDISLGGMLTKLKQIKDDFPIEQLCYSVQETVFAMLVEISERALAHCSKSELVLGGGVACNARLQGMCKDMCVERGAKFFVPEKEFLVDNAAMIAWTGMKLKPFAEPSLASIDPYERTDDVNI